VTDPKERRRIRSTFDRNISQIERCLEGELNEAAIVLMVSVFETFLKDVFIFCKNDWFKHLYENDKEAINDKETIRKIRRHIYKYLDKIKAFDDFMKMRYIYSYRGYLDSPKSNLFIPSDIQPLFEVLFKKREGKEEIRSKINFQNLKNGAYGVQEAYKTFLNINLKKCLDKDKWNKLMELFVERHKIVHNGKETKFLKEDIRTVLDSIKYLKESLDERLMSK
jgi:hypothetical protein